MRTVPERRIRSCGIMARSCRRISDIVASSMMMEPDLAPRNRKRANVREDFLAPALSTIAMRSPQLAVKEMPLRTGDGSGG